MARFADGAARLAGAVAAITGWRADDFWSATPDEIHALLLALSGDAAAAQSPPDGALLARLKEQFPDE